LQEERPGPPPVPDPGKPVGTPATPDQLRARKGHVPAPEDPFAGWELNAAQRDLLSGILLESAQALDAVVDQVRARALGMEDANAAILRIREVADARSRTVLTDEQIRRFTPLRARKTLVYEEKGNGMSQYWHWLDAFGQGTDLFPRPPTR
jgi:hypothetical protein